MRRAADPKSAATLETHQCGGHASSPLRGDKLCPPYRTALERG